MYHHLSPGLFPPLACLSPLSWTQVAGTRGRRWLSHSMSNPPPRQYILSSCEASFLGSTDPVLLSPPGPSTPPEELQLSALDSSSVLVSWRPPLEPNGIITSYKILYSGNLSQPEHLWKNLSQDGECWLTCHDLSARKTIKIELLITNS